MSQARDAESAACEGGDFPRSLDTLVPATLAGLTIGPAVTLHGGSTLLVVGNALRLLRYSA